LTVLFLFGLVLFIRVVYIPTGKVWYDEVVSVLTAKESISEIHQICLADTNTPAYYVLLHYYIQTFGDSEIALRFLSIIFGLLSSVFIFLIVRELTQNKLLSQIVLFLIAVSPFHLHYSHEIRAYSLIIFLSSVTLLSLFKRLDKKGPAAFWDVLYATSLILGAYLHITYLFYIAALNIFLIVVVIQNNRRDLLVKNFIIPNVLLAVSVVGFYLLGYPQIIPQIKHTIDVKAALSQNPMFQRTTEDFLSLTARVYWYRLLSPGLLVATVAALFLGFKEMAKRGYSVFLFLLILGTSLLAPPQFPSSSRYLAYSFPVVVLLLSFAGYRLVRIGNNFLGGKVRINKALVIIMLLLAVSLSIQSIITSRESRQFCSQQLVSFFEENNLPESVILIIPSGERHSLLYYFKEFTPIKGFNAYIDEFGCGVPLAEDLNANWGSVVDGRNVSYLKNYTKGFRNIWYVNRFPPADPESLVLGWLVENTNLEKIYYVSCSEIRDDPATKMPVFLFRNEEI